MGKTNWHKKIYKYLIIILKGKQYHYLSGKYKLKAQYQYTFTRMTKSKRLKTPSIGEDVEKMWLPYISGGRAKYYFTLENCWAVKNKHLTNYDSEILFLKIYPREISAYVHKNN